MTNRYFAILMLLFTTAFWGLAYPVNKALLDLQHPLAPHLGDLVLTGLTIGTLCGFAALCLLMLNLSRLRLLTGREVQQGLGVGFFTAVGIWLLFLGLRYTLGSTVAFLNQLYSAEIVIFISLWERKWPSLRTLVALVAMVAGCWVLSGFDPRSFSLGKGELFGLLCSLGFAAQVLWNGRAQYAESDGLWATTIMAATVSVLLLAVSLPLAPSMGSLHEIFATRQTVMLGAFSAMTWIVGGYWLLIAFQRYVPAMQAAVILAFEPVFAAVFALFVPGVIGALTGAPAENEKLTQALLIGGGLILLSNLVLQSSPSAAPTTEATCTASPTQS